ncbi:MAG: biotin--[acetyl-CoA-carboxylase] ligase [Epulopiscium sp. Nuni2H_MBin003]|nr:MAG: biotin--[acetyl-CoA-carboxylase] ligase [Epulopiscium sp. Nuni2H_MBin003]
MLGKTIIKLDEVDSTNLEIKRRLETAELDEGTIVLADMQNLGKGRLGRVWNSPKGVGIWLSILLYPDLSPTQIPTLTLVAGLSMAQAIQAVTAQNVLIKWPNDLVLNNKKICGILSELVVHPKKAVIIGIGVNVNTTNFDESLPHASSLYLECNKKFKRQDIIDKFINIFDKLYNEYIMQKDFTPFIDTYKDLCLNINKEVYVHQNKETYRAKVIDITKEGNLWVKNDKGDIIQISSGEVSIRGIYGYV